LQTTVRGRWFFGYRLRVECEGTGIYFYSCLLKAPEVGTVRLFKRPGGRKTGEVEKGERAWWREKAGKMAGGGDRVCYCKAGWLGGSGCILG